MGRAKKRSPLSLPIILFSLFLVFVLANRTERESAWYEDTFWWMLSLPSRAMTSTSTWVSGTWAHYFALVDTAKENDRLQQENSKLHNLAVQLEETKQENARLRELLNYRQDAQFQVLTARVIGNDPRAQFKSLAINRGKADGLSLHMPVVVGDGVVGRIAKLGHNSSLVLLLNDSNSAVDVLVQRSRARALLVGDIHTEYGSTRLEYLQRNQDVQNEDVIVTSGFDGLYPSGLAVGKVVKVRSSKSDVFHYVEVKPFVDFNSLQEVSVLLTSPQLYE